MEWVTIITTILPIILQIINKPRGSEAEKAEMLAIGNDILAVGIANDMPELRLAGQYVVCVAKGDEARAGKLIAVAEQLDGIARAAAERAAKGA
jgi:hypothetical protein